MFLSEAQDEEPRRGNADRDPLRSSARRAPVFPEEGDDRASPAILLSFRPFQDILRDGLLRERLMATLSGFFGGLAALLAMIGLYGVISYMVVRRRNEIGVRIAMGATRGDILGLVLREAGALLGIGLAIGAILAVVAATWPAPSSSAFARPIRPRS